MFAAIGVEPRTSANSTAMSISAPPDFGETQPQKRTHDIREYFGRESFSFLGRYLGR